MIQVFKFLFLWILFSLAIGGKNWRFPHGLNAALQLDQMREKKVQREAINDAAYSKPKNGTKTQE